MESLPCDLKLAQLKKSVAKYNLLRKVSTFLIGVGLDYRLKNFNGDDDYYSQCVAVVNSSGTGKTRGALQLGASGEVFIFYCSLAGSTASALPSRTPYLADKLAKCVTTWEMGLYYVSWLEVLAEYLNAGGFRDFKLAARMWLEKQDLTGMVCSGHIQKEVERRWSELQEEHRSGMSGKVQSETEKQVQVMVKAATGKVLQQLGHTSEELKLLFVIDEATGLLEPVSLAAYDEYQRAAMRMGPATLVVLMGTDLSPYWKDDKSKRMKAMKMLRPFWHVNNMDSQVDKDDDRSQWAKDPELYLVSMDRLSRYGRPLWYSRYANRKDGKELLDFAAVKLLNLDGTSTKPAPPTMEQSIALLRFTVGLEVHPRAKLAGDMVSGYMSTLVMIGDEGRALWTMASSEPVLSMAATRWLREPVVLLDALRHLKTALQIESLSQGDRGELVASILVVMAMWECQKASDGITRPVPAMNFLRRVLGDDILDISFLEDAVVFFNRVVPSDHVPSALELMEHFKRGEIICGTLGNAIPGADRWIPMWMKCKKTGRYIMQPEFFSCIMLSDKAKARAAERASSVENLTAQFVGMKGIEQHGYVTWLHDLRIEGETFCTQVVDKPGVRRGFRLQGVKKSPVFANIDEKIRSEIMEGIEALLDIEPFGEPEVEDVEFLKGCPPWMFKKTFTAQELNEHGCEGLRTRCMRCLKTFKNLARHKCKK